MQSYACMWRAVSDSGWLVGDLTVSDNNSNSKQAALSYRQLSRIGRSNKMQ